MRTLDKIPTGGNSFPPAGKHLCRCTGAKPWTSPTKHTPAVMLSFTTADAMYQFDDPVFMTAKAIGRLALVAKRLCRMPAETELPDDDLEAAKQLARYIADNAHGKDSFVTIEENIEEYMVIDGPDVGQTKTRTRHRVAFAGYEQPALETENTSQSQSEMPEDDDIPF